MKRKNRKGVRKRIHLILTNAGVPRKQDGNKLGLRKRTEMTTRR